VLRGYLVSETEELGTRRVPIGSKLVVGRASDCGFVIDDAAASRWHVEITEEGGVHRWKDLGSTNGTLLNGVQKLGGELAPDDELQIGETVLVFKLEEVAKEPHPEPETTVFKETIVDWNKGLSPFRAQPKADDLLRAVYAIANEIASNYEPCDLVDRILETTIEAVGAQRGTIVFAGRAERDLMPCPVCRRYHVIQDGKIYHPDQEGVRISRTVAGRVLSRGESVLFQDTDQEDEFAQADSVLSLRLRSIICVPLRGKYGILGILYMDTDQPDRQYSHDDMLLATAVGNSAGLALENATMHRQILEKQRMEQEIQHAWKIQEGFLLTDWPDDNPRFQVYGETKPAKTVGGDFYDFVQPTPDVIGLLVGDVSGKGVPASLTMAQLLTEFRVRAREVHSPEEVVRALNRELYGRSQRGMFCTLCYITLDLSSGRACCANAGHHPVVQVSKGGVREFGRASGPPAGVIEEGPWHNDEFLIEKGDTVLLYTDGIVEARSAHTQDDAAGPPEEYGTERLSEHVRGLHGRAPKDIVERVNESVLAFCAPTRPHDDCTMIAATYRG
jgi:serine phosphatase RsbU (regulator of sigma subunit)